MSMLPPVAPPRVSPLLIALTLGVSTAGPSPGLAQAPAASASPAPAVALSEAVSRVQAGDFALGAADRPRGHGA